MSSASLGIWLGQRATALDELVAAHGVMGGTGPGRRHATLQLNYAFALLLSSQFQGFCRDLHSETIRHLSAAIALPTLAAIIRWDLSSLRRLDHGNPNPSNIQQDFGRLGLLELWPTIHRKQARARSHVSALEVLNEWRNAIAHHAFTGKKLVDPRGRLHLRQVKRWRAACDFIVRRLDQVVGDFVATVVGHRPW